MLSILEPRFEDLLEKVPNFENEIVSVRTTSSKNGPQLNSEDFNRATKVPDIDPVWDENQPDPILQANAFKGDIKITNKDIAKNAVKDRRLLWRKGRVPYVISNQYKRVTN